MKSRLARYLPSGLILAGMGVIILALSVDLLGYGGKAGIGDKQVITSLIGVFIVALGIAGLSRSVRARIENSLVGIEQFVKLREQPEIPESRLSLFKQIFLLAIWSGVLVGYMEVIYQSYLRFVAGKITLGSKHYIWMIPMADMMIMSVLGIALFLTALILPKIGMIRPIMFAYTFLSSLLFFSNILKIQLFAMIILSLGLAYQLSAVLGNRPVTFMRFVQQTTPWMVLLLFILIFVWLGYYL